MKAFDQLLMGAYRLNASDIHFIVGQPPVFRVAGDLKRINAPLIGQGFLEQVLRKIMPERLRDRLKEVRGADFAHKLGDIVRFRCVAFISDDKLGLTMRLIPLELPTIEQLNLAPVLGEIALIHRGMVLLTGQTGSGKSTTLAAMINLLNNTEARRIITIEDPIEFLLKSNKCLISQRQIGLDIPDFMQGLRQAMRMDPDVILVGEMRDVETIRIAIKAAETGHLVFSTLHTTGAVHTIQRIIGHFEEAEHEILRDQLSLNLRASITQRLVKTRDGKGRRAALEIMTVNPTVAKLIKENRLHEIDSVIRSRQGEMQVMDQALAEMVNDEIITFDEATKYCDDYFAFKRFVEGVGASGDAGAILSA